MAMSSGYKAPKATFYTNANYLDVQRLQIKKQNKKGKNGKRGFATFSRESRTRLYRSLATIRKDTMPCFVTLTYPGEFPGDPEIWKNHLKLFLKRLCYKYKDASGYWKLEPQKRGAPHYHLMVWGVEYFELWAWVGQVWFDVVGSGDIRHLHAGTRVELVKFKAGLMRYVGKYIAKIPDLPEDLLEAWKHAGRWWGAFVRSKIPYASPTFVDISEKEAVYLIRLMRKRMHLKGYDLRRLSMICDADFWFNHVLRE
jgi:hypothetical protein